ncbi:MAG: hypothetical protein GEU93_05290 [Propionibacteriales bacterium]|nr:hypothetical protein [Propionibacteriales bacterium]
MNAKLRKSMTRAVGAGLIAGGLTVAGTAVAQADTGWATQDDSGLDPGVVVQTVTERVTAPTGSAPADESMCIAIYPPPPGCSDGPVGDVGVSAALDAASRLTTTVVDGIQLTPRGQQAPAPLSGSSDDVGACGCDADPTPPSYPDREHGEIAIGSSNASGQAAGSDADPGATTGEPVAVVRPAGATTVSTGKDRAGKSTSTGTPQAAGQSGAGGDGASEYGPGQVTHLPVGGVAAGEGTSAPGNGWLYGAGGLALFAALGVGITARRRSPQPVGNRVSDR